ncbi:cyclic nucleotide-binding domain-containing protein [Streptomyces sp. NPDC021224]|uniref:cyclic nucleotide-binding domain-containing protein n=1 Tax=unclassified Streptomyces TaxID=2593676 RepID=UPI0037B4F83D
MTAPGGQFLTALPAPHRERLLGLAVDRTFPAGTRIFEEDAQARRFWVVRSGLVALDAQVPGRRPAVVETLGAGELLGWSWLFEPYRWHLGAEAREPVEALEFDAATVRRAIDEDPSFGLAVTRCVAAVAIGRRLRACRIRLLDLYGPEPATGSGRP